MVEEDTKIVKLCDSDLISRWYLLHNHRIVWTRGRRIEPLFPGLFSVIYPWSFYSFLINPSLPKKFKAACEWLSHLERLCLDAQWLTTEMTEWGHWADVAWGETKDSSVQGQCKWCTASRVKLNWSSHGKGILCWCSLWCHFIPIYTLSPNCGHPYHLGGDALGDKMEGRVDRPAELSMWLPVILGKSSKHMLGICIPVVEFSKRSCSETGLKQASIHGRKGWG